VTAAEQAPARRWMQVQEKGSILGMTIVVTVARLLGRRAAGLVIRFVAAWYVLFAPAVRRASRGYLVRVRGQASLADVYRHVFTFAQVATDRLFMVRGDFRPFRVTTHGEEHLRRLRDERCGALLVLAHLGSFEVLRALSRERNLPVNVLGYFQNARMLNAVLRRLDPTVDARLIEIRPGDPSFVFEVEDRIARGELVGTMGDRVGHDGKAALVDFLGAPAAFPTGPYLLAAALRCPVYLAFGMYQAPDRYDLFCEPFAPLVELPRGPGRAPALQALARCFAERLEHYCRAYPDAWFNFYDFWDVA
jgi:predicted LPLAT superfamily acyltransferase